MLNVAMNNVALLRLKKKMLFHEVSNHACQLSVFFILFFFSCHLKCCSQMRFAYEMQCQLFNVYSNCYANHYKNVKLVVSDFWTALG